MTEAIISGAISGILVIIEFLGLLLAKWTIVRKPAEKAALEAMAEFSRKFNPADVPADQDVTEYIMYNMESKSNLAKTKVRDQVLAGMIPGPELCFFALTIQTAVFLTYNYSSPADRIIICPLLAGNNSAIPIFVGTMFISLMLWWLSCFWREALVSNWQKKARMLSMFIIASIGCLNLSICFYMLIVQR